MSPRIIAYQNKTRLSCCGTPVHFQSYRGQWKPTNGKWVKVRYSETNPTKYNILVANTDKPKLLPKFFEETLTTQYSAVRDYPDIYNRDFR